MSPWLHILPSTSLPVVMAIFRGGLRSQQVGGSGIFPVDCPVVPRLPPEGWWPSRVPCRVGLTEAVKTTMSTLIAGTLTRLARPYGVILSSSSRRWRTTEAAEGGGAEPPAGEAYHPPTCRRTLGPHGGFLLSPSAVKNLFNFPEFKHQKRAVLPFKKSRLQRMRRLKDNKNKV